MAEILDTGLIRPEDLSRDTDKRLWIYCGIDALVPQEILQKLLPKLDPNTTELIYTFERAMQGPALAMSLRGVRVDEGELSLQLKELETQHIKLQKWLTRLALEISGEGLNYKSPAQLKVFFYEVMKLPVQYKRDKGEKKVSCDRDSLEKLRFYFHAIPIINTILKLRDLDGLIKVLKSGVDSDSRMRASFNPSATETGRWSSSKNVFGGGTNLMNITERMRKIFIPDPGRKFAYPDLAQAESFVVAYISQDQSYILACKSGDLHTMVARLVWPEVEWTGDLKLDREIAERPYYRHFNYRDLAKRGGHASNYGGQPWTISKHLKIDVKIAEEFHDRYFSAFPGIRRMHHSVQELLMQSGFLTTPLGRKRCFMGRLTDDATLREAIAYTPQSTVVEILNIGLYRVWRDFDLPDGRVQLLIHLHDGFLFQFWEEDWEILEKVQNHLTIPIEVKGETMVIPVEIKVGYTWYKRDLIDYLKPQARHQSRPEPTGLLDWRV